MSIHVTSFTFKQRTMRIPLSHCGFKPFIKQKSLLKMRTKHEYLPSTLPKSKTSHQKSQSEMIELFSLEDPQEPDLLEPPTKQPQQPTPSGFKPGPFCCCC